MHTKRHSLRTIFSAAILLLPLPAWAADATPGAPPAPPPVAYDVWGFKWNGQQYVRQAVQTLHTSDLKKAADYTNQINGYAGWTAITNLPEACVVHTVYHGRITHARPAASPDQSTYSIWAFQQVQGQWVRDERYSWTTHDPVQGLKYSQQIDAVAGWRATSNCPQPVPAAQRYVAGGPLQGAEFFHSFGNNLRVYTDRDGGQTIYVPRLNMRIRVPKDIDPNADTSSAYESPTYDNSADNSSAIQDMINTQNMINNQNMLNNQMMNNNLQDMINTQNAVNTQNMIDAQNAFNAQNNP